MFIPLLIKISVTPAAYSDQTRIRVIAEVLAAVN